MVFGERIQESVEMHLIRVKAGWMLQKRLCVGNNVAKGKTAITRSCQVNQVNGKNRSKKDRLTQMELEESE